MNEKEHLFGFPYKPYDIQQKLMSILYQTFDDRKIGIFESPTGTGKSLSTICASLSWLENNKKKTNENIESRMRFLEQKIKDADKNDDWMGSYTEKFESQNELSEIESKKFYANQINERIKRAKLNSNLKKRKSNNFFGANNPICKRKIDETEIEDFENEILVEKEIDMDLIPTEVTSKSFENDTENQSIEKEVPLRCTKIIYASRTHSQLEQFVSELRKTRFDPRVLTVGSRQLLCINESVKSLKNLSLINDRCNELLNTKTKKSVTKNKRIKSEEGSIVSKASFNSTSCACEYSKSTAIEDLADEILAREFNGTNGESFFWLTDIGKEQNACPYFASKNALSLCELVLVPYNILLHKSTREAWNLDLKDNIVIVDEAHNLLQALASIHSCEIDENRLAACCSLISDYIDKFRSRLSSRNLLNIRQLHTVTMCLLNLLKSLANSDNKFDRNENNINGKVYTLLQFHTQLDCLDIDFFKLISYLEESNLCRKLRDFQLRYSSNVNIKTETTPKNDKSKSTRISKFLQTIKKTSNKNDKLEDEKKEIIIDKKNEKMSTPSSSAPLYQLKDFLEALTTKAEDARIVIQKATSHLDFAKYRFLLLNPADKLKDIVKESRSFILIGGTMKPVDQLLDAFYRVCGLKNNDVVQFSCGHVIDDSQLIALSLAKGPSRADLNLCFSNRSQKSTISEVSRCFINLLRQIPNGVVAFFPSYSFLDYFIKLVKNSGELTQIQNVKQVFLETRSNNRANSNESIWPQFCKAAKESTKGALLFAVVGGSLSEGINFSDELGRCVIMIGLPYANKNSIELSERMKYVDEKIGKDAGSKYYESLCIHAVNQAIGRAIRHRKDHAAIVLLDMRYLQENISSQLPDWIRKRLFACQTFSEALSKLVKFFRDKKINPA